MQYGHLPIQDRDPGGSASFHQNGLGQALHLNNQVGPPTSAAQYSRSDFRNPSTSPPTLQQQAQQAQQQQQQQQNANASNSHSPLAYVGGGGSQASPAMKRKQIDSLNVQSMKRRRDTAATGGGGGGGGSGAGGSGGGSGGGPGGGGPDEPDGYADMDSGGQGAKHWTDEEKTKLFSWLMAPGNETHWNALRATKNSCLRDCAQDVFGGKKTYQALKGCYERNFNLFKQIYAFENAHGQSNSVHHLNEADRIREIERRLTLARKNGSDVGNITARTIDHWHRHGWYNLFYHRWHEDPATTRTSVAQPNGGPRSTTVGPPNILNSNPNNIPDDDDDGPPASAIDYDHSSLTSLAALTSGPPQPSQTQPQNQHDRSGPPATPQHQHQPPPSQQSQQQQQQQQQRQNYMDVQLPPPIQSSMRPPPSTLPPPSQQQQQQQQLAHVQSLASAASSQHHPNSHSSNTAGGSGGGGAGGGGGAAGGPSSSNGLATLGLGSLGSVHVGVGSSGLGHGVGVGVHQSGQNTGGLGTGGGGGNSSSILGVGGVSLGGGSGSGGGGQPTHGVGVNVGLGGVSIGGNTAGGVTLGLGDLSGVLTQDLLTRCLHYLNVQTQVAQEKLDYLRRKERREMEEYIQKEKSEKAAMNKARAERAFETINNPNADPGLKNAATEYLRKMFLQDG